MLLSLDHINHTVQPGQDLSEDSVLRGAVFACLSPSSHPSHFKVFHHTNKRKSTVTAAEEASALISTQTLTNVK